VYRKLLFAAHLTTIDNCKANPEQLDKSRLAHCKNLIYQQIVIDSKGVNFFTLKKGTEKTEELKKYTEVLLKFIPTMNEASTSNVNETMEDSLKELEDLKSSLR
jgi:N-acetylglutamate synthase/N-acetylornithine aminotransferase